MDNEEFLNILRQVNTLINVQLLRLDSIERMNPKQSVYLQQINNALIKPEESCDSCFVLPAISVGGGAVLYAALKSLTIEAFYIEEGGIPLLKYEYQNLTGMLGHLCNRAQFKVFINGLDIGHINLNNGDGGQPYPRNTESNGISAITNSGGDFANAKYSRIDVSEEQAQTLATLDNRSLLSISLSELIPDPHAGVTWVRLSVRTESGSLVKLYDQLVSLNYKYTFDILRPGLGLIESPDNSKKLKYVKDFTAKRSVDDDFQSVALGVDVAEGTSIELKVEVVDDFSDEIDIVYSLPSGAPLGVQLNGNTLTVGTGVSLFKQDITVGYKVTTVLDPLNTLEGVFTFKLSVFNDLSASVVYKQNGVWKSLETGATIPNGTLQAMSGVSEIIMSDKVTDIGDDCFSVSSNSQVAWTKMKLSANLKTIGQSSLTSLGSLDSLVLPEGLLTIGNYSVQRLGGTLVIPQSLKAIPDGFLYQWNPKTYTINLRQTTLTTIRDGFERLQPANKGRYNILLPDSLLEFSGFRYMLVGKVQFGRNIQTIHQSAFGQSYDDFGSYVKVGEITILRADVMVEPLGVSPMGSIGFHADRKLKVPFALVDAYKGSAQWAKLVSNENIIGINPDTYE